MNAVSNESASSLKTEVFSLQRLEHLPVAIFSVVMGMSGLTLAWLKAHAVLGWPPGVGEALRGATSALLILLLLLYGIKAVRSFPAVLEETRHPIQIHFFPTLSISLLLLATAYLEAAPPLARWLWTSGTVLHLCLTLWIFNSWIYCTHYATPHVNPAWFIPAVGNIIIPVAGVPLSMLEWSWFFFSIGLVFWLVLMAIVFYRIFFYEPLPARLIPTLFILLAPPSVGFISYVGLTGQVDGFARILYYTALFLALLLASTAIRFLRIPFFISSWAYSFPLAALTLATLIMAARLPEAFFYYLANGLLILLNGVVAVLAIRTLLAVWHRHLCLPESGKQGQG